MKMKIGPSLIKCLFLLDQNKSSTKVSAGEGWGEGKIPEPITAMGRDPTNPYIPITTD